MSRDLVCDASALTALLLDAGETGTWVAETLDDARVLAPDLACWETGNIIRRHELRGLISADQAAQAYADLLALAIEYWPFELLAVGAWSHRENLTIYDAGYVTLAELIQGGLVTLDRGIAAAPALACAIMVPPTA